MKLSMWMIANRLSSLEMEVQIAEDAPAILNSARRAYATNCVHVYQDKEDVICNGENNTIVLKNMDVVQAFEIIQSVFDFYEDWIEWMICLIRKKDYQELVNQAWLGFHNPLILFDGNNKVLGISEQYAPDDIDDEWSYLCRYGYSSLNAVQYMRFNQSSIDFSKPGLQAFAFAKSPQMAFGGISYPMFCDEITCGRLNILAKDRPLNLGDYQLLEKLISILEPNLGQLYYETYLRNSNVFYNVLFGKAYDEQKLQVQMEYQQWSTEDLFQLAVVQVAERCERKECVYDIKILLHTIQQQRPDCVVLKKGTDIMILSNKILSDDKNILVLLRQLARNNPIRIGFSLPADDLLQVSYLYNQATAAIELGCLRHPRELCHDFFNYAADYIIEAAPLLNCVHACHPLVRTLWQQKSEHKDDMFDTLQVYLENDCSVSRTADLLFIHRNTIVYRTKKLHELFNDTLRDVYVRDYVRISIRVIKLYAAKYGEESLL
ncbi:MAG: PucR family transcriptional regulator [Lachnospiraceae bacterium]